MLYRQTRVGRDGVVFRCVKFRTMVTDAEPDGKARLASEDDQRVVPALRWMRSTTRRRAPPALERAEGRDVARRPAPRTARAGRPRSSSGCPATSDATSCRPGLTGLAQIHGRYGTDAEYKLGYDLQYLVNWSIVIDVQILFRTVWVVLSRRV